jgi:hypothetical protein
VNKEWTLYQVTLANVLDPLKLVNDRFRYLKLYSNLLEQFVIGASDLGYA